jgi:hypothetical protein
MARQGRTSFSSFTSMRTLTISNPPTPRSSYHPHFFYFYTPRVHDNHDHRDPHSFLLSLSLFFFSFLLRTDTLSSLTLVFVYTQAGTHGPRHGSGYWYPLGHLDTRTTYLPILPRNHPDILIAFYVSIHSRLSCSIATP